MYLAISQLPDNPTYTYDSALSWHAFWLLSRLEAAMKPASEEGDQEGFLTNRLESSARHSTVAQIQPAQQTFKSTACRES